MNEFSLLRPDDVISQWGSLRKMLAPAIDAGSGELEVDDIRRLVLGGRMFVFASGKFALTCEFVVYPKKTVMIVGFGAGVVTDRALIEKTLIDFAKSGGATSIQTYCKNPAMVRYYRRWFNLKPTYTVLERPL